MAAVMGLAGTGVILLVSVLFGVRRVLLAVMLIRPSCDRGFDWVKTAFHQSMGPGAAVNLLVIGLALTALVHAPRAFLSPPVLAWGGFLLAALASWFTGRIRHTESNCFRRWRPVPPSSPSLAIVHDRKTAAPCLWIALLSSLVPTVWGLAELAMMPDVLFGPERIQGSFSHPNIFAYFIVSDIALVLFLTRSTLVRLRRMHRWSLYGYVILLLILLAFTKARGAWVAMFLIWFSYALFIDRRWFVLVAAVPVVLFVPGISDRINDLYTGNTDIGFQHLNSLAWRELLWANTLQWMADNPAILLGHGLDLYQSYVPLFFPRGSNVSGVGAHNTLLQLYFETGLFAITAFFAIFFALLTQLRKGLAHDRDGAIIMAAACVAYLAVSYADNLLDYLQFQWFFWFVLGTVAAWMRSARERVAAHRSRPPSAAPLSGALH